MRRLATGSGIQQADFVTGTGKLIHVGTEELIHLDEGIMAALSGDGLVRGIHADQDIAQAGQDAHQKMVDFEIESAIMYIPCACT